VRIVHRAVTDSIERWLELDRDVVVTGDVGSGKSVVAEAIFESLRRQGRSGVLLRGVRTTQPVPLAPFAGHQTLQLHTSATRWSLDGAVRELRAETEGRHAVLVVDDLHLFDDASLAAIGAVLGPAEERPRLVATIPSGARVPVPTSTYLREAVTEVVRPLDVAGLTDLLVDLLGAPVDARLVTAISARSQGNARVCRVLAAAGAHAGLLRKSRGLWTLQGSLDTVANGLPAALLFDTDDHLFAALETIAAFGMLENGYARRLVGDESVDALLAVGRLRSHRHEGETFVLASPPALAIALRTQLGPERRSDLVRRAAALSGDGADSIEAALAAAHPGTATGHGGWDAPPALTSALPQSGSSPWQGPAETAGLLAESLTVQRSMARTLWEREPTVAHALTLLHQHLYNDSDLEACREIFARTKPGPDDGPRPSVTFTMMRGLSEVLGGRRFAESVRSATDRLPEFESMTSAQDFLGALDQLYSGERVARLDGTFDVAALPWPLGVFARVLQARIDLDLGRPDRALDVLGPRHRQPPHYSVEDISAIEDVSDTIRTDALLLAGQLEDAVHFARTCMAEAYDRLSEFGIRMSARSLATALYLTGDHDGALQAVDVALHLVRGNPLTASYDERVLGLGAVLYARRREHGVAQALLDRLQSTHQDFDPGLDLMLPWARLEVEFPHTRSRDAEARRLWDYGTRMREEGLPATAALCWVTTPAVLDDDQLAQLDAVIAETDMPLLGPAVTLHHTLAHGSAEAILSAASRQTFQGPLLTVAGERARAKALEDGLPPLTDEDIRRHAGPVAQAMLSSGPTPDAQQLTERELEVALLAREGLSNRQIASRVFLSVRTVENHLYRAMRKIGVSDRSGLAGWQPPS
jgi:DNA-binding CsgD family transcriptional regulator/tetratricopeptide (TPR) repeat protein